MRKNMLRASAALVALALAASAQAQTINFDALTTGATVDKYYAGGIDSFGETGPDYGIAFTLGDWSVQSGFGETSQPNFAYSISGGGAMDSFGGMTNHVAFSYGAFSNTTVNIYSGLDGGGSLLASYVLTANDPSHFDFVSLDFAGTAHSVQIAGGGSQFGWDDIGFGTTGSVPEPASWALMLGGFGLVGGAMRRRQRSTVRFA